MGGVTAHLEFRSELELGEWATALRSVAARVGDMTPANRQVGEKVLFAIARNFETNGAEGEWAPLSEATLIQRAKGRSGKAQVWKGKGAKRTYTVGAVRTMEGAKALIDSTRLIGSITYRAVSEYVDIGSNVIYAAAQFFGLPGPRKWGRATVKALPARNPLKLLASDEADIERIYVDFILAGLRP